MICAGMWPFGSTVSCSGHIHITLKRILRLASFRCGGQYYQRRILNRPERFCFVAVIRVWRSFANLPGSGL